jgi:predicted glycosyltransferase
MRVLFDINHPAHVHLFRNFIRYLLGEKHLVLITAREKDVTNQLLDYYGFEYISLSKPKQGIHNLLFELMKRDVKIFNLHRKHRFDVAFGTSVSISHLSAVTNAKSYAFNEDDDAVVPMYTHITYPFCTKIINPSCLRYKKWTHKRILHDSYHELSYLHPNNFTPSRDVLNKYSLREREYVIIRLSALRAHHDIRARGISLELLKKIEEAVSRYAVIRTVENHQTHKIDPWDMHHILAFAKMIISDSQTMTIEASVLGVPAIRINSFYNRSTVLSELEKKYKLTFGFSPDNQKQILQKIDEMVTRHDTSSVWSERRTRLLLDKIDFNRWMVDFFEKDIQK